MYYVRTTREIVHNLMMSWIYFIILTCKHSPEYKDHILAVASADPVITKSICDINKFTSVDLFLESVCPEASLLMSSSSSSVGGFLIYNHLNRLV